MGERIQRIIAKQRDIQERLAQLPEPQAWQQDYAAAEDRLFAEKCLPQKPAINLNHINIEWEDEE